MVHNRSLYMYAAYVSGHFKAQVFSGLSSLLGEKPILSPIIPHFELVAERELRYHTPLKPLSPRSQANPIRSHGAAVP